LEVQSLLSFWGKRQIFFQGLLEYDHFLLGQSAYFFQWFFAVMFLDVSGRTWNIFFASTWNAKSPIFLGNFTPKTSNFCLRNRALGFPGIFFPALSLI